MNRVFSAAFAAACLLLVTACGGAPDQPAASSPPAVSAPAQEGAVSLPPAPPEPTPAELAGQVVEDQLSSMTLAEKVGQLFFVRCPAERAVEDVTAYHLGGYLLFGRDFKDAAGNWLTAQAFTETVQRYQSAAMADTGIPLLIGCDEEGGSVVRASANPNLRSAKFQSPQRLFAAGGMDAILADVWEKDAFLKALGINVNFAPVCDLSTDPDDFIYDRAFGQDVQATSSYAAYVTRQMAMDGMGSVMKHFPGYGSNADTHTGIAIDPRPLEQFQTEDFQPFLAGADMGRAENGFTTSVLVSHNIVQCMDPDLPASLSPAVHEILREQLGDLVVMTDDLAMDAVAAYAADGAVAVLALEAGNDMVVTTDYRTQIPKVLEALEAGRLIESDIDAACRRVLQWKQALGLLPLAPDGDAQR